MLCVQTRCGIYFILLLLTKGVYGHLIYSTEWQSEAFKVKMSIRNEKGT